MRQVPLLVPYTGTATIQPTGWQIPVISLAFAAYRDTLRFLAHSATLCTEFSWVGKVASPKGQNFFIQEVRALRHISTTVNTRLDALSIGKIAAKWIEEAGGEYNPLKFWGHTHMGHSTDPSPKDEQQMANFVRGAVKPKFFIRGIFGLAEPCTVEFSVYDYEREIVFRNVPWHVVDKDRAHDLLALSAPDCRKWRRPSVAGKR